MASLLKLEALEVDDLFGIFNYQLKLNVNEGVTILHGLNGVGKTTLLKMIAALVRNDLSYFHSVPFRRFFLRFEGENSLEIVPQERNQATYVITLVVEGRSQSGVVDMNSLARAQSLATTIDYLSRRTDGSNEWIDERDGEVLSVSDVLTRFGESRNEPDSGISTPTWLQEFTARVGVHLVETHRLEHRGGNIDPASRPRHYRHRSWHIATSSVKEYSRGLANWLQKAMADYGRRSQPLDQSFPTRLLSKQESFGSDELRRRMRLIDERKESLTSLGVLDQPLLETFEFGDLGEIEARVMTQYVKDTEEKLSVFDNLAARSRVLLESLNGKFSHKAFKLDSKKGLVANTERGVVALDMLSSGEQHELVLHYILLFRVRENEVVLIDEPELSFHVTWQKSFIEDLLAMREVTHFDAIIATHSPYIVGRHSDLMVQLGELG